LSGGAVEGFISPGGAVLQFDHPLSKAALLELGAVWPRALAFDELVRGARGRLGRSPAGGFDDEAEGLAEVVLAAYGGGLAAVHLPQAWLPVVPGERPVLSPLARWQLTRGREVVTGLRHTCTRMEQPAMRELLLLLDGTRDAQAVAAELGRRIDAGQVPL